MVFNSFSFVLGLIPVILIFWCLPPRIRLAYLLLLSVIFISTINIVSVFLATFLTCFNYSVGFYVVNPRRKTILIFSLFLNALAIVCFHLLNQKSTGFSFLDGTFDTGYLISIGISYYTIQHCAYLIDLNKQRVGVETDFSRFLFSALYFPKFVSGPIVYYQEFSRQFNDFVFDKSRLASGLNRFFLGLFKKVVLADRLAPSVESVFDYNDVLPGFTVWAGGLLFTLQLYLDFSGYSDMALGLSRMFGIELPENFGFPLRAKSISEFWRRWHITLMSFFTTYIYFPIAFYLRKWREYGVVSALIVVFMVSSLWHGLGLTYLAWALCHIVVIVLEQFVFRKGWGGRAFNFYGIAQLWVLLVVSFSNIFFRSKNWDACIHLMKNGFNGNFLPSDWLVDFIAPLAVGGHQINHFNFAMTGFLVVIFLVFEKYIFKLMNDGTLRVGLLFCLFILMMIFGVLAETQRFIYIQF